MKVKKQNFYFKSSNKETRVHGVCWIPEGIEVKAVVQIAHGMLEFMDRYDDFGKKIEKIGKHPLTMRGVSVILTWRECGERISVHCDEAGDCIFKRW